MSTGLEVVPDSTPSRRKRQRVLDNVNAYAVQCARCLKWRFVNSKKKYEQIRETIVEQPFFCETAREWRPSITCDDEPDLKRDGSWRWAIDKPCIPQTPPGWERVLRIRAQGGTRFADLYYVTPSGDYLRSSVQVQSYLNEHPECVGVDISQFSFQIPSPLEENYLNKSDRATSAASHENADAMIPVASVPASMGASAQTHAFQGNAALTLASEVDAEAPVEG